MMTYLRKLVTGDRDYSYSAIPEPDSPKRGQRKIDLGRRRRPAVVAIVTIVALGLLFLAVFAWQSGYGDHCEESGNCIGISSKLWGQYSPVFSVPSEIDPAIPDGCEVTFASVLARHGARDPTARKSELYKDLIERIQGSVSDYGEGFEFLREYKYTLGSDQLTLFGEQQLVDLGVSFGKRYEALVAQNDPFTRAAGQERVVASAEKFTQGLYSRLERDGSKHVDNILVIPEEDGFNNSLNHGGCPRFEDGPSSELGHDKQNTWKEAWVPRVQERLNFKLPGANLSLEETIYMMDLCPFNTVADPNTQKSDFCRLFSKQEWVDYDYFESLEKWYAYGTGNPLGATQGVGFVNELIARLTGKPVHDETTTNSTLDSSPTTFPLNRRLYADFSHDNTMASIYATLGLYNNTKDLPTRHTVPPQDAGGFSAAWTVPFAGRMYVEKMRCGSSTLSGSGSDKGEEEMVRVLINDRVIPLPSCNADGLGRCRLSAFIESLSFARSGGRWHECLI